MGNSMHQEGNLPMTLSTTTFSMLVMGMVPLLTEIRPSRRGEPFKTPS